MDRPNVNRKITNELFALNKVSLSVFVEVLADILY